MGEVRRFAAADVRIMELVTRDESAVPTLRWEACTDSELATGTVTCDLAG